MFFKTLVPISLAAVGVLSTSVYAEAGLTREQVKAELEQAIKNGDFPVSNTGQTPRDRNPSAYPSRSPAVAKTREEVKAELAEAVRMGNFPVANYGKTPRDRSPSAYPSRGSGVAKTR